MTTKNARSGTTTRPVGNGSVTVSQGTRSRFLIRDSYGNPYEVTEVGSTFEPSSPLRTNGSVGTLRALPNRGLPDISATLNPKRVSVATSTFWEGHPDMAQLVNHVGMDHMRIQSQEEETESRKASVWSNGASMASWGWGDPPALKKGILLQQKEQFLARWKERYCILTRDYLHCFRRTTSIHRSGVRLSEMGNFIFKLRLADIEDIQLEKRRVGIVISILLPNEPKILFKVLGDDEESTTQWFTLLQECLYTSKERRQALRTLHSSGTEALRTQNRNSLSEGSPTSTSSSTSGSDAEKNKSPLDCDAEQVGSAENVILRKNLNGRRSSGQDAAIRHSVAITEDFELCDELSSIAQAQGTNRSSRRPESWAPEHPSVIYKTPTLVPSASWLSGNQRRSIATPSTYAAPTFSRATQHHLYATSRHSSEITFRKMS